MSRLHRIDTGGPGRLAIMARPGAGYWLEFEVAACKGAGLDAVVSLLEADEVLELGLEREPHLCVAEGIRFLSFPIPDRGVPESRNDAAALARSIATAVAEGHSIAVDCRAGIGRSSVIAACALVCLGLEADSAFRRIGDARGVRVPDTDEQFRWVIDVEPECRSAGPTP